MQYFFPAVNPRHHEIARSKQPVTIDNRFQNKCLNIFTIPLCKRYTTCCQTNCLRLSSGDTSKTPKLLTSREETNDPQPSNYENTLLKPAMNRHAESYEHRFRNQSCVRLCNIINYGPSSQVTRHCSHTKLR
jgi:hypothetical protein